MALGFMVSRCLSGIGVVSFPKARADGTVAEFSQKSENRLVRGVLIFYLVAVSYTHLPTDKTEILYEILIFLRIYLAGISFSLYCFYHKNSKQATFMGTMIYVFAGWMIYAAMKHPYFSNPCIYLPLILMGIDKIYKKEKPHLFICATAVGAMSNFYFFYMLCIFMFLYAAFRYFRIFSARSVKDVMCLSLIHI